MKLKAFLYRLMLEPTDDTRLQFFRSLFVGGIATLCDMAVLNIAKALLPDDLFIPTALGFLVGVTVNYIVSTRVVFANRGLKNKRLEFMLFAVIGICGFLFNYGIMSFFESIVFGHTLAPGSLELNGAKLVSTLVVYIWNFSVRRFFLYRNKTGEGAGDSDAG